MGKGPGTIYNDCIAYAILNDKVARQTNDELMISANDHFKSCCLLEPVVKKFFVKENYGERAIEKAIKLWIDADMVSRLPYMRHKFIVFGEAPTELVR